MSSAAHNKVRCQCGATVAFDDELRGTSVYCDSCGREVAIPERDVALSPREAIPGRSPSPLRLRAGPQFRQGGRYSQSGVRMSRSRAWWRTARALCTHRFPVTLGELGTTVYCPRCGLEAPSADELKGFAGPVRPPATPRVEIRAPWRRNWSGLSRGLLALVALAGVVIIGAVMTTRGGGREWLDGFRPVAAMAPPPTPVMRPADEPVLRDEPDAEPPEITLATIEALLAQPDPAVALAEARWLLEQLQALGVAGDDPRIVRLTALIDELDQRLARLRESPSGSNAVQQFRSLLQQAREALKLKETGGARAALDEARELFAASPDELGFLGRSLRQLEEALRQLEFELGGVQRIETQLRTALREAEAGNVTEAIRARAEALQTARYASMMSAEDEEQLKELNREIDEPLRLAIGRRALTLARELQELGDKVARDREIRLGKGAIEGLLSETIAGLIDSLNDVSSSVIENPTATPRGRDLAFLHAYESLIEQSGRGDLDEFVLPAMDAWEAAGKDGEQKQQVTEIVLDMAERTASEALRELDGDPSAATDAGVVRNQLQRLSAWSWEPRMPALMKSLDEAIREVASAQLEEAITLAEHGDYQGAVELLKVAVATNDDFVSRRAAELQADWERRASEAELLAHLQSLVAGEEYLAGAREAALFLRDYPESSHTSEVLELQRTIDAALEPAIAASLQQAEQLIAEKQFGDFRRLLSGFDGVPIPADALAQYDRLRGEADRLKTRADVLYRQAQSFQRMLTEKDVRELLERLPGVIELDPEHAEASRLYEKAKQRGGDYARIRLDRAETQFRLRKRWDAAGVELLREVVKLDPDGFSGRQALQYLEQAGAEP